MSEAQKKSKKKQPNQPNLSKETKLGRQNVPLLKRCWWGLKLCGGWNTMRCSWNATQLSGGIKGVRQMLFNQQSALFLLVILPSTVYNSKYFHKLLLRCFGVVLIQSAQLCSLVYSIFYFNLSVIYRLVNMASNS